MAIIKSSLASGERWTFCTLDGYCYMTNGKNKPLVWDGVVARNMGMKANGTAATFVNNTVSGNLAAAGAYYYKYTYWNSVRNRESDPNTISAVMTSNADGAHGIRITIPANASLEAGTDYVKVYRVTNGGAIYYYDGIKAYTGSSITYDSSTADGSLAEVMGELNDAATANDDIRGVPLTCRYILSHKGRVVLAGSVKHTDGTCAVTNGSSTVTGTSANITAGMDGWFFLVNGQSMAYVIGSINTTAQTFELLDSLGASVYYKGTTDATASYTLYNNNSLVYYSYKSLYGVPEPESFPSNNYMPINPDDNDEVSGLGILKNHFLITKRNSLYLMSGDFPEDFRVKRIEANIGSCSHWTICQDREGNAIFMHESGVYLCDGNRAVCLSDDIENIFTGKNSPPFNIVAGKQTLSHAVFDIVKNRYMLWVCTSDYMDSGTASTICDKILIFDFNKVNGNVIGWSWWDIPATASAIVHSTDEVPEVWFGDAWGFVKKFDDDALNDGVGSGADTRRGTATSGDTTSIIDSGATFYTTGSGLQGCFAHIISGTNKGEIRRITTNTSNDITVTPAFTSAIDITSIYAIGGINARRLTKIYDYGNLRDKILKKVKMVFKVATSTYSAFFKFYKNKTTTVDSTKYFKVDDAKGYYESRYAANRSSHHQYEFGLHDVDKTMVIQEIEIDVEEVGAQESRVKRNS